MVFDMDVDVQQVKTYFLALKDPRSNVNQKHPFISVIMIAVLAVLAGADGPTAISRWALLKSEWLHKTLDLPHGIPGKDVFWRVLAAMNPTAFQSCFYEWLGALKAAQETELEVTQPQLIVDGKTLRRSHNRKAGLGPLHSVSVWAAEAGLTLGQVACDAKSNEITAIPEVLRLVQLEGSLVTIDAMGTQKAIAKQIIEGKADYVLALKGNHKKLYKSVVDYVAEQMTSGFINIGARQHATYETSHGREESRLYIQMPAPQDLPGRKDWKGIKTIGVAIRTCIQHGKETVSTRYYISSLPVSVKRFSHAVRQHWAIENTCHWTLDHPFREDESRIANVQLRENFAWLNRFGLSLLKQHPAKISTVMKRRSCAWNDAFLLETVLGITE